MGNVVMYMGLSGSGKTYLAYKSKWDNCVVLDSDEMREKLFGDAEYQGDNEKVFNEMKKETIAALACGRDVFYVATNLNSKKRSNFISEIKKKHPDTTFKCIVVVVPLEVCIERNEKRNRQVPVEVIKRQMTRFQMPFEGEGWDSICCVYNYNSNYRSKIFTEVKNFGSQENHNHNLNLYEHCEKCGEIAYNKSYPVYITQACLFHDYGKAYTKTYWEKDNFKEAHYPNHENVGAYLALVMGYGKHVAQLICYHMLPYIKDNEKWKEKLGDSLWNDIMKVHECDEGAK